MGDGVGFCFRPAGLSGWVITAETEKVSESMSDSRDDTPSYDVPMKIVEMFFITV